MPLAVSKRFRNIIITALIAGVIGVAAYEFYRRYKAYELVESVITHKNEILGIKDLDERRARFSKSPTVEDCAFITDKLGYALNEPAEAIPIGEKCLTLPGVESVAYLLHFWLADYYNRLGRVDWAATHLEAALRVDAAGNILSNNWISQANLDKVYASSKKSP